MSSILQSPFPRNKSFVHTCSSKSRYLSNPSNQLKHARNLAYSTNTHGIPVNMYLATKYSEGTDNGSFSFDDKNILNHFFRIQSEMIFEM